MLAARSLASVNDGPVVALEALQVGLAVLIRIAVALAKSAPLLGGAAGCAKVVEEVRGSR
eukprot:COSAG01_NODE_13579_length_1565_cov_3.012960_2_plen_60_part_00